MNFKKYFPEFIYGSMDGTITTFAIVSSAYGANLSNKIVLILGFANILADGFSMASSNYLSERSKGGMDKVTALVPAFATFSSFILIGAIPLLAYIIDFSLSGFSNFKIALFITILVFVFLGYLKGRINSENKFFSIFETVTIGSIASFIAYIVGFYLDKLF